VINLPGVRFMTVCAAAIEPSALIAPGIASASGHLNHPCFRNEIKALRRLCSNGFCAPAGRIQPRLAKARPRTKAAGPRTGFSP
jgi:hypothetical protein